MSKVNPSWFSSNSNRYGHPQKDMLEYLDSLGPVERTDLRGDIVKKI